jgi:hypothetical protein
MRRIVVLAATTAIVAVVAAVVVGGCGVERRASGSGGSNGNGNGAGGNGGSGNGGTGGSGGFGGGMGVPQNCPGGGTTTLSGTVFAPNGSLPLYDAIVYVPTTPVAAFTDGVTCDRCDGHVSGAPVVWAITAADGTFTMKDTPWGAHVRRQVTLPSVTACQTNPVDATLTRLPRSHAEGDLPRIAIAIGRLDPMECLLLNTPAARIGFAPASAPSAQRQMTPQAMGFCCASTTTSEWPIGSATPEAPSVQAADRTTVPTPSASTVTLPRLASAPPADQRGPMFMASSWHEPFWWISTV